MEGKVALVTGGARGIGLATGVALAKRGVVVHLADLSDCAGGVSDIEQIGGTAGAHTLDIRDRDACAAVVESIVEAHGGLDYLVCNAGVCPPGTVVGNREQWEWVIDINLRGTQNTIDAAWESLRAAQDGRIVIVSSMAYYQGGLIVGTEYSASKAALIGMTRHIARNGGPEGILCNAVAPGIIETDMTADFDKLELDRIPLRRYGTAEDCAGPIAFLCSPDSSYMTGTVLNVTGGIILSA